MTVPDLNSLKRVIGPQLGDQYPYDIDQEDCVYLEHGRLCLLLTVQLRRQHIPQSRYNRYTVQHNTTVKIAIRDGRSPQQLSVTHQHTHM